MWFIGARLVGYPFNHRIYHVFESYLGTSDRPIYSQSTDDMRCSNMVQMGAILDPIWRPLGPPTAYLSQRVLLGCGIWVPNIRSYRPTGTTVGC